MEWCTNVARNIGNGTNSPATAPRGILVSTQLERTNAELQGSFDAAAIAAFIPLGCSNLHAMKIGTTADLILSLLPRARLPAERNNNRNIPLGYMYLCDSIVFHSRK